MHIDHIREHQVFYDSSCVCVTIRSRSTFLDRRIISGQRKGRIRASTTFRSDLHNTPQNQHLGGNSYKIQSLCFENPLASAKNCLLSSVGLELPDSSVNTACRLYRKQLGERKQMETCNQELITHAINCSVNLLLLHLRFYFNIFLHLIQLFWFMKILEQFLMMDEHPSKHLLKFC